jgi:hypothetical protein
VSFLAAHGFLSARSETYIIDSRLALGVVVRRILGSARLTAPAESKLYPAFRSAFRTSVMTVPALGYQTGLAE